MRKNSDSIHEASFRENVTRGPKMMHGLQSNDERGDRITSGAWTIDKCPQGKGCLSDTGQGHRQFV